MSDGTFKIDLEHMKNLQFKAHFDSPEGMTLIVDEPLGIGDNEGPNPARLVGTAVGDCLTASLLFCLQKSRVDVKSIKTHVEGTIVRNENKRLRMGGLDVTITIDTAAEDAAKFERCLGMFEDFCVVTATVRQGVPVKVTVVDPAGKKLFGEN
jgi:uncharacterized OsmC-like protein